MSEHQGRAERSPRSKTEWRGLLDEMDARGLSVQDASREFGVSKQNLYQWRKKLRDGGKPPAAFVEIPLIPPQRASSIEIHCGRGTKIVCSHLSITELAGLVRELEGGR